MAESYRTHQNMRYTAGQRAEPTHNFVGCPSARLGAAELFLGPSMQFKAEDRVRRIGQNEVGIIKEIREPDEYIVRLNPFAETMCWIQLGDHPESNLWVKESQLELVK